ncbi:MAG: aspartate--tRNA ligase [bacterium]|nr:aspartate--tRNA ligase [Deltaproteobacteria bacterium]MCP4905529.1 aspartate--tRNA ligase [bacterium]
MGTESVELDGMGSLRRSHRCGEIMSAAVGDEVVLAGWVHRRRDHGGVIFVDLRDKTGIVQVVFRPESAPDAHARAHHLRSEWVLMVRGEIECRSDDTINRNMETGSIEVNVRELRVLNSATVPPFAIEEEIEVDEQVRLKNRLHDLRRPPLQRALRARHDLSQAVRASLNEQDFMEIETPMLARATPEGARDFLVPSRLQGGDFYALPQSPQIMKQLFMIAGCDRYYQIARCFRDEDQRADRQLEFTQIDLELSFVGVEEILAVLEKVTVDGSRACGVELEAPFKRITYEEAMGRYGSDRPDTRILLELHDLTDVFLTSEFKAFRGVVEDGGVVKALPIPNAQALSRGEIDRLEKLVRKELGAKGLGWIRVEEDGSWKSPITKFLGEPEIEAIRERCQVGPGMVIFFQADTRDRANTILSRLREDLGVRLDRVDRREWDPLLVIDFPLLEPDENGKLGYVHQPFVAPVEEDLPLLDSAPEKVRGTHYDVVLNGTELGSGSLRNHRADVQRKILGIMGYSDEEMAKSFGFMLDALDVGAPPHGGFAFGFDRWVMKLAGFDNLRDVIAFPKTQRGQDLLMAAPSSVDRDQLEELSLRIRPQPSKD